MSIGVGCFFAERFEDAVAMLLRSLQEHPGWAPTYRFLAAGYAQMGRLDDAREVVGRLRAITPSSYRMPCTGETLTTASCTYPA